MNARLPLGRAALVASALAVVATATPLGHARAGDAENKLVAKILDHGLKLPEREAALAAATLLARNKARPKTAEVLRPILAPLLRDLHPRRADPAYGHFLELAFEALTAFEADRELAALTRPYLKDTPDDVRASAVAALDVHGAAGMAAELVAIFEEPAKTRDKPREQVLRGILRAMPATPGPETQKVLLAAAKQTTFKGVRLVAIRALGETAASRVPGEIDVAAVRVALAEVARVAEPDQECACAAALALVRHDSYAGVSELVRRLDDKRKCTREVYGALCEAFHHPGGFKGVSVERFYDSDAPSKAAAVASIKEHFSEVADKTPDDALFVALGGHGIAVPTDTRAKEAIAALVEALDLEQRDVRYAALDLLAKRTARVELAREFKILKLNSGSDGMTLTISTPEPPEGFTDPKQQEVLRRQQRERVVAWRKWWEKAGPRATLVNGVWTASK